LKAFLRIIVEKETTDATISLVKDILFIYPKLAFQFESEIYWKDDRLSLIEGFIETQTPLSIESWENFFKELIGVFVISDDGDFIELAHYAYSDNICINHEKFAVLNIPKTLIS
jgi:hypothetical protein